METHFPVLFALQLCYCDMLAKSPQTDSRRHGQSQGAHVTRAHEETSTQCNLRPNRADQSTYPQGVKRCSVKINGKL